MAIGVSRRKLSNQLNPSRDMILIGRRRSTHVLREAEVALDVNTFAAAEHLEAEIDELRPKRHRTTSPTVHESRAKLVQSVNWRKNVRERLISFKSL